MTPRIPLSATKEVLALHKRLKQEAEKQNNQLPSTIEEVLTEAQQVTGTHYFPGLDPVDLSTGPSLEEMLAEHKASVDELAVPFSIYHDDLSKATPQAVRWLWQKRLPLAGITLLDGDHACGKSLLALQIAASVSSGSPMPDGTPTIQGGVVIISPPTDATTTQLQLLTALGADLSRIKIISFIRESAPEFHTGGHRPFSLPKDFLPLFLAIKQVDARLVIFDPFLSLLSREQRCTNERLCHLLIDLNQRFIERDVACLLIRNCPAKGGHARPSVLERSDHFLTTAASRLLLAPDPMQPDRLLLAHAHSRHAALTPTLLLQIRPLLTHPDLARITILETHNLQAQDLIVNRPDTLHRRLLSQHLFKLLSSALDPVHVSSLYARSPNSSPFQVQRSLSDLLKMGQIERPSRGFYSRITANPVFKSKAATTSNTQPTNELNGTAATTSSPEPTKSLNGTAAIKSNIQLANELNGTATTTANTQPANELNGTAARTANTQSANELNGTAARTSNTQPANELNGTATRTSNTQPANELNGTAARTANTQSANELKGTATRISNVPPINELKHTAARTSNTQPANELNGTATRTSNTQPANELNGTATRISNIPSINKLNGTATRISNIPSINELNSTTTRISNIPSINELNSTATRISNAPPANELNVTAATTPNTQPANPLFKPCPCGAHGPGCQCVM
jgi:hypothetical protein